MPKFSLSSPSLEDYETYQNEYWKNTHRLGSTYGVVGLWLSFGADLYVHHWLQPLPLLSLVLIRVVGTLQLLGLLWVASRRPAAAQKPVVFLNFLCTGAVLGLLTSIADSALSPPFFWTASLCVVFVTGSYPNTLVGSLMLSFTTIIPFFMVYFGSLPERFLHMTGPFLLVMTVGPTLALVGSLGLRRSLYREFQTRKRLAITLQDVGDGVIATNSAGKILFVNRKAQELTGVTEAEAWAKYLKDIFPWLEKYSDGVNEPVELKIPDPAEETWISLTVTPLDGSIFSFQDITQRKRYEAETIRTSRMEALKLVAGGIAHDFNNLLMAVTGSASLLMDEPDLTPDVRDTIGNIEEASKQASRLADRLLTFSKGGSPVKELHSLDEIVKASASFVLSGSKVKLETQLPPDLWPCEVDASQFGRVIQNLTINSVEAMPEGGLIRIECRNVNLEEEQGKLKAGRHVEILFIDNGQGIPEEMLGRVFDPYFTTKASGSGLGLAASYSIVEAHGGALAVSSTPGVGTEFRILLPASDAKLKPKAVKSTQTPSLKGGRVLVLEDEAPVSRVLARMLEKLGFACEVTSRGEDTLEVYEKAMAEGSPFDVVILDLTVPGGMGGEEAIKRLHSLDPEVKAIVSSGYSDGDVIAEHRKFGFQGRLTKPYGMDKLRDTIGEVLRPT